MIQKSGSWSDENERLSQLESDQAWSGNSTDLEPTRIESPRTEIYHFPPRLSESHGDISLHPVASWQDDQLELIISEELSTQDDVIQGSL